jgi:hypothetical protein
MPCVSSNSFAAIPCVAVKLLSLLLHDMLQVTASGTRGNGRRSLSIQGSVQLQAQGRSPTTVARVQVNPQQHQV